MLQSCQAHQPDECMQRRGKKILVLDPRISGFLRFVAEVPLLREHGVEQFRFSAEAFQI